jgi:hypothetical protein
MSPIPTAISQHKYKNLESSNNTNSWKIVKRFSTILPYECWSTVLKTSTAHHIFYVKFNTSQMIGTIPDFLAGRAVRRGAHLY